jgi:8-oxo-dGTP pyrophosphatase MutT (NUDIX family)
MHRKNILTLLEQYLLKYTNEKNTTEKFIQFVKDNQDCFERKLQRGHLTGSAWVLNNNKTHVLLTHHKKLNKWLQLGGHADGDSNIINVALREVEEESGLTEIELLSKEIFDLDAHVIPARGNEPEHIHYDVRFLFKVTGDEKYIVSHESFDLAWIKLDEVDEISSEESLLRMVKKTNEYL